MKNLNSTEARIYPAQVAWIKANVGKKAADQANYGWGVTGDEQSVSVQTKVYGNGILTSEATYRVPGVLHDWQPFGPEAK